MMLILSPNTAGAQTAAYSAQRVYLKIGDVMHVSFFPPKQEPGVKTPVGRPRGQEPVVGTKVGIVDNGDANIPQYLKILSGKRFNISVISQTRSLLPTAFRRHERMIYLTDVLYTASQQ